MISRNRKPTHPGEMLLKKFLAPNNINQKAFSDHLGWTYTRLNEITRKRRGITADSAIAFAKAFRMEPEFWMNLQRDWDLWHALKKHSSNIKSLNIKHKKSRLKHKS